MKFDLIDYTEHVETERALARNNCRKSNIEYYVDKDKKTIVAVLHNSQYDVVRALDNMGILFLSSNNLDIDKCMLKPRYVGKAICYKDDEWDENIGKEVAKSKALEKYYRDRVKAYEYMYSCIESIEKETYSRLIHSKNRLSKFSNK